MKKEYQTPSIERIELDQDERIATSGYDDGGGDDDGGGLGMGNY